MINTGDLLPDVTLYGSTTMTRASARSAPMPFPFTSAASRKKWLCSVCPARSRLPAPNATSRVNVAEAQALFAAGVDEILCVSVNDAFVMNAWGNSLQVGEAVRMIGDGNGEFSDALGLIQDLSARGLGRRSLRYAMVVDNLVVAHLAVEAPGKFEVSDAASVLATLRHV